ncbi:MAG: type II toxin-antitoxin system VapC family toxin [Endozoicomonadaceae bacterium]|nr:type II toxin-antitoxin system VapC family toxin [Endozoicomonadaceae bacterium]
MIAVDTNILVRFLVGDDTKQANKVYRLFKKIEGEKNELFIPTVVILELIWVLESVYEIARSDILDSISQLMLMPIFQFENPAVIQNFISEAQKAKLDLSDLLIVHSAKISGCKIVLTFDKKASKYKYFDLLK